MCCKSRFKSPMDMAIHKNLKHPIKDTDDKLRCSMCKNLFKGPIALKTHIQVQHFNYKPFQCEKCSRTFTTRGRLNWHLVDAHNTEKNKLCDKCDARFHNAHGLWHHMRYVHNIGPDHKCPECDETFKTRHEMEYHVYKKHEDGQAGSLYCDKCPQSFKQESSLKLHMSAKCGRASRNSYLTELGVFPCKECDRIFRKRGSLYAHTRLKHTLNGQRYACQYCPKDFSVVKDKRDHENSVHLNIKPWKCNKCDYATVRRKQLTDHVRIVHDGIKIPCDYPGCSSAFNQVGNLDVHKWKVHKIPRPKDRQAQLSSAKKFQ